MMIENYLSNILNELVLRHHGEVPNPGFNKLRCSGRMMRNIIKCRSLNFLSRRYHELFLPLLDSYNPIAKLVKFEDNPLIY